jgi:hypothetical protein
MPRSASKKQLILDLARELGLERVKEQDLRRIQAGVRQRLAESRGASLAYIASVLRSAGTPVDYQDRFSDPVMEEPYASRLKDVLKFGDLAATEHSLRKIHEQFVEFRDASDHKGKQLLRTIVLRGKERATSLARNPRVSPRKHEEKKEIAQWFRVWLESPDLFLDWLDLRKQSEEFRQRFAALDSGNQTPQQSIQEGEI